MIGRWLERRFEKKAAARWQQQQDELKARLKDPAYRAHLRHIMETGITRCSSCLDEVVFRKNVGEKYTGKWFHVGGIGSLMCQGANPTRMEA